NSELRSHTIRLMVARIDSRCCCSTRWSATHVQPNAIDATRAHVTRIAIAIRVRRPLTAATGFASGCDLGGLMKAPSADGLSFRSKKFPSVTTVRRLHPYGTGTPGSVSRLDRSADDSTLSCKPAETRPSRLPNPGRTEVFPAFGGERLLSRLRHNHIPARRGDFADDGEPSMFSLGGLRIRSEDRLDRIRPNRREEFVVASVVQDKVLRDRGRKGREALVSRESRLVDLVRELRHC